VLFRSPRFESLSLLHPSPFTFHSSFLALIVTKGTARLQFAVFKGKVVEARFQVAQENDFVLRGNNAFPRRRKPFGVSASD